LIGWSQRRWCLLKWSPGPLWAEPPKTLLNCRSQALPAKLWLADQKSNLGIPSNSYTLENFRSAGPDNDRR
jgi:hypothetical protein